ncbi:2-dehydro-3-deoxy-D-gluconate 5-dehydrogenase KduD [Aureimonas flava]|uniref:2-dehydro-3-deoxy-D-gluconate 5-dehydrogenase KduD n=1 Tax=Aureimonas flava TaxID=2320271 RepID=A0A3A1WJZ7_9HYPH|nr:2-dehydro-3-deoxy-D-gluconate 5-dehydrogenase KduD [Aureimonas flava]RIX99564.1 2-dehydro-3-deoxy-D-gluconate 5-dehydrogenase KduD [Aureimonas flava]
MSPDPFSLQGRRIAVTGANTGIGQGIAIAVAEAGGAVVGIGRSAMDETAARVEAAGGAFTPCLVDLSDIAAGTGALERIAADAPLDGLVNNAGIIRRADSIDFSEADWDAVMDVNLKSVFFLSQAFARSCLSAGRPGRIVNIASLLSFQGGIRVPAYTAAKHGVAGVTRILANEWAARGINVNAIAPGYIETNNTVALRADPDRSRAILERIPAGRWGVAEDIGAATVFLLAEASRYVHGTVLPVDGGWLAR